MKKLLVLAMVIGLLAMGCVSSKGWARKDGQPINTVQFQKDRKTCNKGWGICLAADILLTGGILSIVNSIEAHSCMKNLGYEKIKTAEETE